MSTAESIDFKPVEAEDVEEAVATVLDQASQMGASDLFLATTETGVEIAVRHLGIVRRISQIGRDEGRRWLAHIKVLADIPIDNRRHPAEGRFFRERPDGHKIDLRVNTLPTLHGEDFAIRLLERNSVLQRLDGLGFDKHVLPTMLAMLHSPGGLILVTGPTSSGKTTTLYAALHYLNDGSRKINTIEDPIEYAVEGIRQSQVNPQIEVDFPELLRSVLRQSPDVIMIGEIRDVITAQTAVRAANSGHLVLATLHAPTAAGAIQSMLNLGVHPHFFASSLRGVIAQRLVRTLCSQCRLGLDLSEAPMTFEDVKPWLGEYDGRQLFTATGCDKCGKSGYAGRTGVFELLNVTPKVRQLINALAQAKELEQEAIAEGMFEFRRAGLLKVATGQTNTEEIVRVVPAEHLGLA
jgi:type II secretory ATPase GspE/PulE/Tfp pilus assembly ATPase PilB-like protein